MTFTAAPSSAPPASSLALPWLDAFAAGRARASRATAAAHGLHLHAAGAAPAALLPREGRQGLRAHAVPGSRSRTSATTSRSSPACARDDPAFGPPRLDLQLPDRRPALRSAGRASATHLARSVRGRAHRRPDALPQPAAVVRRARPVVDPQRRAGAVGHVAVAGVRQAVPRRPARRGRRPRPAASQTARASSTPSATRPRRSRSGLGAGDREKLDEYFTSVRELEQRLAQAEEWSKKPKPKVEREAAAEHPELGRPHRPDAAAVRPDPPGAADRFDAAGHAHAARHERACRRSRACRSATTTCRTTARTRPRSRSSRPSKLEKMKTLARLPRRS